MTGPTDFAKMLPGYDFLQGLLQNAGAGMPNIGQWIAPTLNPDELEKRIGELRTVQFWLEQNARLLGTTIQALEVQRMTLSTLRSMNVPMPDLREALKPRPPAAAAAPAPEPAAKTPPPPPPGIDPMQWWGALTQQFGEIASAAMQDVRSAATPAPAPAPAPAKKAARKAAARPAAPRAAAPRRKRST
ncbi:PhaM family polyhydroxyalkanoate granule multifunctional regulatory protein [Rubrivivax sp. JA1026]|uniref:PhaM family polyhydroxyalkanoate granule multifunctional regulatory protein n=1 Tax=Rubrivivax sp. JA1026 TaxID=2710888 RepID=UPI0013E95CB6|nr:PhaM family polyhydroxyalkanoate granule multifunctional regulatory protein [Rubrivivax sp. JA1026]